MCPKPTTLPTVLPAVPSGSTSPRKSTVDEQPDEMDDIVPRGDVLQRTSKVKIENCSKHFQS